MDNKELLLQISEMLEEHTTRINIKIENEITKRIDSLYDGQLAIREILEESLNRQEKTENRIDSLETRVTYLESKAV